jgi:cytoskeletal protein CcmA (bactofilin family)
MHKLFVVCLISVVSLFAIAAPAAAMDWRGSDRSVVGKDEVVNDDVSLAGANVIVDGTVNGDVFAIGTRIQINGTINGNLIAIGERVVIAGDVAGSVYSAAAHVSVSGRIERTLAAAGSDVTLEPGAFVGSSGLMAGGQIHVSGEVGRGALLGGAHVEVDGQIGQELKAYGDRLRIGPGAVVEGPVEYTSSRPAAIEQGARTGAVAFHQIQARRNGAPSGVWWKVFRVLGFLPVGLALLALFPSLRGRYPEIVMKRPWRAPLAGLMALIAVPIGAVLLLVTVIGAPFGLVGMALFPALIYLSQVLVSWTAGKLLADRVEGLRNLRWPMIFLIGALLTSVATSLPGVGWLVGFGALLYGLGGLYYLMVQRTAQEGSL